MFRKVHKKISTVFRKGTKPSIERDISQTPNISSEATNEAAVETDDLPSSSGADDNNAACLDLIEAPQSRPALQHREQLEGLIDSLAMENFNLKLQIFLLEEKLKEQQIDAEVEIEALRLKLEEKEENLRQAAQTIDEMEQIRKEREAEKDVAFEELKEEILNLQMDCNEYKRDFGSKLNGRSRISEDTRDLDEECEQKIEELVSQNTKLSDALEGKEGEIESAEQCDKYVTAKEDNTKEDDQDLVNVKESEQSEQSAILALIGKLKMTRRYDDQDLLSVKESEVQPCTSKSTISTMKLENPKGVLENMLQFEQTYFRFNAEHNFPQKENLFLKGIINKLQRRVNEESLKAEEEASKKIESNFDENPVYRQAARLKNHLRLYTGELPFLCSKCGKSFHSSSNLNEYLKRHSGVKRYECSKCPKTFTTRSNLSQHIVTHSRVKSHICLDCGAKFHFPYLVKRHISLYHNKSDRPHQCEHCEWRFRFPGKLRRHMLTHTGEKPYKCKYCERTFSQSNECVRHLRSHLGKKVYQCELCPKAFRKAAPLRRHFEKHKNENEEARERNRKALLEEEQRFGLNIVKATNHSRNKTKQN